MATLILRFCKIKLTNSHTTHPFGIWYGGTSPAIVTTFPRTRKGKRAKRTLTRIILRRLRCWKVSHGHLTVWKTLLIGSMHNSRIPVVTPPTAQFPYLAIHLWHRSWYRRWRRSRLRWWLWWLRLGGVSSYTLCHLAVANVLEKVLALDNMLT
jgi:hypothetical protein